MEERLRLGWGRPVGAAVSADGGWMATVSWVPLGEGRGEGSQVAVPLLLRCGGDAGPGETFIFDPLPLPLEGSWAGEWRGVRLELRPASGAASERSWRVEPPAGCPAPRPVEVRVRTGGEADLRQVMRGPGEFIQLVAPAGSGRGPGSGREMALLHLGGGTGSGARVGILEAREGSGGRGLRLRPVSVPGVGAVDRDRPPRRRHPRPSRDHLPLRAVNDVAS